MNFISIQGARTHNLKNISLDIPRDKLVVVTGLSGSGKSSLAFDTLYAEGQRRYVESLSAYARQFLSLMEKPDVDHIDGLSPAISIEQKSTSHNPRSTVGTITEIYDYLRLMFARVGEPHCPDHDIKLEAQSISQMVDKVLALPEGQRIMLLAPMVKERKGEHLHLFSQLRSQGFVRARIDGIVTDLDETPALDKKKKHTIEVVVDRLKTREDLKTRLADSFETATSLSDGIASISFMDEDQDDLVFSSRFACPQCGHSIAELEPRLFSFNNPAGACNACDGLGLNQFFDVNNVVLDDELSLAEGAIQGWDRRNIYYFQMLASLAEHFGFELETPFRELSEANRAYILTGTKSEDVKFRYVNDKGDEYTRAHPFEGIIPNMERRFKDTESQVVRENLAKFLSTQNCPSCHGDRLNKDAMSVTIEGTTLPEITNWSIVEAHKYFSTLSLTGQRAEIADKILKEISARLSFLIDVGLNYLSLSRSADTLSGGEAQRIRLASQIGAGLVGVMYILDEPSIGLHQRDNQRLLATLNHLRDIGNTVIVVEHDEEAIRSADYVIDIGPGAGVHGGEVVAHGTIDQILDSKESITGQFLSGVRGIKVPKSRSVYNPEKILTITGASGNNLRNIDLQIPIGLMTCITGVSGSGKSTLINGTLYPLAACELNGAQNPQAAPFDEIIGLNLLDKVVDIDQSPIGRTPRSNPATYTNIFTPIRELFAATQEARSRGYKPGRFSFNVKGGRCEACQGDGLIKVEMHFLPDVYVTCDECKGKRYNRETLEVRYKGKNIHEVLDLTVEDAKAFFGAVPMIERRLSTLTDVGLGYIRLGQSATTLSGGEAQRVKLSRELSKRDTGKTLYILDEPTTGLHFHDIEQLLDVLHHLRDQGNTVVIIEHNLDVIKTADWIVDLGPEGGSGGGQIVGVGTPEDLSLNLASFTGQFLKPLLANQSS
ncbi:MAG: excinuclease ABC subunit UvrA [Pseudomonadales bacterium]|jgi:excinuclease ABC subunit A|tara:strand:- start:15901 stop:18735 length:2835 start_codon:yes stop_codon:yes gene_type:complete